MCHRLLSSTSFFTHLLAIDRDLAQEVQSARCPTCGGRLDVANYPRKPCGGPAKLDAEHRKRLSFSCAKEGCRQRATPPSVRFLARRVYFAVVVVLVTAMTHGVNRKRAQALRQKLGISPETVERWRTWWQETFPATPFWRASRGRLRSPVDESKLPVSLLSAFGGCEEKRLEMLLRFVSPVTTTSVS